MDRTVVGVFDKAAEAQQARQELLQAGFQASSISLVTQPANAAEPNRFWDSIRDFFGMKDTGYYTEAARRGATLLTINCQEQQVERAVQILERHNPIDIDRRVEEWRRTGWQPATHQGEQAIPVVEEQLRVGKQVQQRGGVRVYSRVTEKPVEQQVALREEHVHVERRPADRPADKGAFRERTIEARETREEPVVSKEARVVEEVVLRKDTNQRTETVRDKVRRTDVEVQRLDDEFHKHYDKTYAGSGQAYDIYRPAYDYGRELATDQRYHNRDWTMIEPEARKSFEQRNPGKWDQLKDAVHWGFEHSRQTPAKAAMP
jgi:uncharacterized protein (TIGR02271 family)